MSEPSPTPTTWRDYAGSRELLLAWCIEAHSHIADLQMAVLSADHARARAEALKLTATVTAVVGTMRDLDAAAADLKREAAE